MARLTAKQKREQRETMIEAIKDNADFNGRYMAECFANPRPEDDSTVTATARVVSLLISLREWSVVQPLDDVMIQTAITAWMAGANVVGKPAPMGGETFIRGE